MCTVGDYTGDGRADIAASGTDAVRAWFVPIACVNYLPTLALLELHDPLGFPVWLRWVSPLAGLLFLLVCLQVWRIGVRHYTSTGS